MARRLLGNVEGQHIVNVLLEVLRGSLRKHLRAPAPATVDQLITLATQLEQDELAEQGNTRRAAQQHNNNRANKTNTLASPPPTTGHPATPRPSSQRQQQRAPAPPMTLNTENLPKCRHCPDYRWYRACPKNPHLAAASGNWRGAGESAGARAHGRDPRVTQQQQRGQ